MEGITSVLKYTTKMGTVVTGRGCINTVIASKVHHLIRGPLLSLLVVIFLSGLASAADGGKEYETGLLADWIKAVAIQEPDKIPTEAINDGIYYLLVDSQSRKGEAYNHFIQKIINRTGLENISQISIDFAPSYETLVIHKIAVIRNGTVLNKLDSARIKVFQRESELEYQIYNGEKTFNIVLDDLRVGDIVEYSYTIQGENPLLKDMYHQWVSLQWSVPVYMFYHRLVWPLHSPVHVLGHGTDIKPVVRQYGRFKEFIVEKKNVEAIMVDEDLPGWYYPYPRLEFSQTSSWRDVAIWAMPLYRVPDKLSRELEAKIEEIKSGQKRTEKRALAALRFVQDEIRYLGIEMGVSSYRPSDPSLVFKRRFGDCKDMSLLLHTLLKKMGVTSHPALVSTRYRGTISKLMPSPNAFNHVILRINIDGKEFWIDPTNTYQRGAFEHMEQPPYGFALVISDDTKALTPIDVSSRQEPLQAVKEVFSIRENNDEHAEYRIETTYRGPKANEVREAFATQSMQEMEKLYLNFYSAEYPEIIQNEPIMIADDIVKNVMVVKESYIIPNFWNDGKNGKVREGTFYPSELADYIRRPSTKQRTMPLEVPYPVHYRLSTEVILPGDWEIEPSESTVEDEAVDFKSRVEYRNRTLRLYYELKTKKDHVDASHVKDHIATRDRIYDELGYSVYYSEGEVNAPPDRLNWTIIVTAGFSLAFAVLLAFLVYRYDPEQRCPPVQPDAELGGLRGWLVVIAIGICLQPVRLMIEFFRSIDVYGLASWTSLTTPGTEFYHELFQPLLLFELISNINWIVFSVLMAILFFQKRISFPKIFIAYLIITFSVTLLDLVIAEKIPTLNSGDMSESTRDLIRQGVYAFIWSIYLVKSERVKNTFVFTRPERKGRYSNFKVSVS